MPRPLRKHAVRCAGQRWPRSTTRCLPRRYRTATASKGTATSGSKLQSSSTDRRVGGGTTWPGAGPASAGTGAGPASNASASAGAFQAVRIGFHRSMTAPSYARGPENSAHGRTGEGLQLQQAATALLNCVARWRPARIRRSRCCASRADRKSTRLNSSHVKISYAVFCLKKKKKKKSYYYFKIKKITRKH